MKAIVSSLPRQWCDTYEFFCECVFLEVLLHNSILCTKAGTEGLMEGTN